MYLHAHHCPSALFGRQRRRLGGQQLLLSSHTALSDRIDGFEVRRVRKKRYSQAVPLVELLGDSRRCVGQDVSVPLHARRHPAPSLHLAEQGSSGKVEQRHQRVQSATMGHADHGLLNALLAGRGEDGIERRQQRLCSFEAVPLG